MAAALIKYDVRQVQALATKLGKAMALQPNDRRQLLADLGAELEAQTRERFSTKRAPDGNPWKDIADRTRAYYDVHFPAAEPPLVVSGGLRDSVESQVKDDWSVVVGATKVYAAVQQWGWEARNIAARSFLGIGPQDATDLDSIAAEFLARMVAA